MSSFRKRIVQKPIPGTRSSLQTGQLITSTGNIWLDSVLGGGISIGSITLIEEDKFTTNSKVLTKYFLAEGIVSKQPILFASLDDDPAEFIKNLPKPLNAEEVEKINTHERENNPENEKNVDNGAAGDKNGLRIAWRYNVLLPVNSEQATTKIGHHYNLMEKMDVVTLKFAEIFAWNGTSKSKENNSDSKDIFQFEKIDKSDLNALKSNSITSKQVMFHCEKYFQLLDKLSATFNEFKLMEDSNSQKVICRICISSLGSPLWYDENFSKDILKFLSILRALVRHSNSVCFITIPMHIISKYDADLIPKIRNLVDFSIELESFVGSEFETNSAFKEYTGLIHLRKISAINALSVFKPNTSDLAFKLRRKKFIIEKLHLPPELEETHEKDNLSMPALNCSSNNVKNSLDF